MIRLVIFAFCSLFTLTATAATSTGNARVFIQEALTMQEGEAVDFGVLKATSGTCTMGGTGALTGNECDGMGKLGEFVISGSEDQPVSITVSKGEGSNGIEFNPSLQSTSTPILTAGTAKVLIGGDLVMNNTQEGSHSLTYVITVNYN